MLGKRVDWEEIAETKEESKISYGQRCQEQDEADNQRHSCELNQNLDPGKKQGAEGAYPKVRRGSSGESYCSGFPFKVPGLPTLTLSSSHLPSLPDRKLTP